MQSVQSVITWREAIIRRAVLKGMPPPCNVPGLALLRLLLLCLTAVFGPISGRGTDATVKPDGVDYYTCGMHPSLRSKIPGARCPLCGMEMVVVRKKPDASDAMAAGSAAGKEAAPGHGPDSSAPGEIAIPLERQQQFGVTCATVAKISLRQSIRAAGKVAYDKQRRWVLAARAEGYIQKLQISSAGDWVEKTKPLMVIDSPALRHAQEELLDLLPSRDPSKPRRGPAATQEPQKHAAAESRDAHPPTNPPALMQDDVNALEAARGRLLSWGMTRNQVTELEQSHVARDTFTLFSPCQGVVQDLPVEQGQRVCIGDRLVDIVDLSAVWVWAEFYEDQLAVLAKGLPVTITSPSFPAEKFEGKITAVDPFMNEALRTVRVRIEVANPDLKLRPAMYVDVQLTLGMGESLAVPVDAVLPTGQHNVVFIAKGEGRFEPRFIELGGKYGEFYEVKSGLKETERVVTSATFLIDAEAKVQGALKSW